MARSDAASPDAGATPRGHLLNGDEWPAETHALLANLKAAGQTGPDGEPLNSYRLVANHPALLRRWIAFATHFVTHNTLPPRDRELVILRTAYRCGSNYEWGHHVIAARAEGLDDAEIAAVGTSPSAHKWSEEDALLLRAVDELHDAARISDETWAGLAARCDTQALLDLVFTVGHYAMLSFVLNSFVVPTEAGIPPFPPNAD